MKKADVSILQIAIGLVIGLVVLLIFLGPLTKFLKTEKENCKDQITLNSLDDLILDINSLTEDSKSSLIQITTKGCSFVPFNIIAPNPAILAPDVKFTRPHICLCQGSSKNACLSDPICKEINFDKIELKKFDNSFILAEKDKYMEYIYLKKEDSTLIISKEDFEDSGVIKSEADPEIKGIPLPNIQNSIKNYDLIIQKASTEYKVSVPLIKAIITQESRGISYVISSCGAVGLMQLMPGLAREYGLKTFQDSSYTGCNTELANSIKKERNSIRTSVFPSDINSKLFELDERFDPEKNIIAGTKHLKDLIDSSFTNGDLSLVIAAYNGGTCNKDKTRGALCPSRTCSGQLFYQCEANKGYAQTRDYVDKVFNYKTSYEAIA